MDTLKTSLEIRDRRGESTDFGNLGLAYSDLGEYKKAIEHLEKSLTIGREIEDPMLIQFCEQLLNLFEASKTDLKPEP